MKSRIAESVIGLAPILDRYGVMRKDLAKELGTNPETVSRWCSGADVPGARTLLRILSYLRRFEPTLRAEDLFSKDGRSEPVGAEK